MASKGSNEADYVQRVTRFDRHRLRRDHEEGADRNYKQDQDGDSLSLQLTFTSRSTSEIDETTKILNYYCRYVCIFGGKKIKY